MNTGTTTASRPPSAAPGWENGRLDAELRAAGELSWRLHGRKLTIALPGMFVAYGRRGRHPAVSLTGPKCEQMCRHCAGRLIAPMIPADSPRTLVEEGRKLWKAGATGLLISGGADRRGRLPFGPMIPAIRDLAQSTGLVLTAHAGRLDEKTARDLKTAGVRQALVDVVGDDRTARRVLRMADGLVGQTRTLDALEAAGLETVPHIILGLDRGRWSGEARALDLIARRATRRVVFVVFMPLKHTPMAEDRPTPVLEVAAFLARARRTLPDIPHHLGCARPRGQYRHQLDALAVAAGINVLAVPSDAALEAARQHLIVVDHRDTCCSLV